MFDDSRHTRLQKRFKGLSRVASAISDLYIYGIYEQNFPVLVSKLDEAKVLVKKEITEKTDSIRTLKIDIKEKNVKIVRETARFYILLAIVAISVVLYTLNKFKKLY